MIVGGNDVHGRPDLAVLIDQGLADLQRLLQQAARAPDGGARDAFLVAHERFVRGVRGVLLDFLAHAFVSGGELRSRFDALCGPARVEPLRAATAEGISRAAQSLEPRLTGCARLLSDEAVPLVVGLLEETELAELTRDVRRVLEPRG